MALTKTDVANAALIKLGSQKLIAALTDETPTASVLNSAIERCKLAVLRLHPWNFAIKRATLAASSTEPEFGYSYQLPLPSDFVRIAGIVDGPSEDYRIEGRMLLCDSDEVQLRYVYDIGDDFSSCDPLFMEALACYLAHDVCYAVTQSVEMKDRVMQDLRGLLAKARFVDACDEPLPVLGATDWLESRFGGQSVYPDRVLS